MPHCSLYNRVHLLRKNSDILLNNHRPIFKLSVSNMDIILLPTQQTIAICYSSRKVLSLAGVGGQQEKDVRPFFQLSLVSSLAEEPQQVSLNFFGFIVIPFFPKSTTGSSRKYPGS